MSRTRHARGRRHPLHREDDLYFAMKEESDRYRALRRAGNVDADAADMANHKVDEAADWCLLTGCGCVFDRPTYQPSPEDVEALERLHVELQLANATSI